MGGVGLRGPLKSSPACTPGPCTGSTGLGSHFLGARLLRRAASRAPSSSSRLRSRMCLGVTSMSSPSET